MDDEFYNKFPSYNENSKECRIHRKLVVDYNQFLRSNNGNAAQTSKRSKIPVSKAQQKELDVFSVEERNRRAENESRERTINYQKELLQQIEEMKMNKKHQKDQEKENERILEEGSFTYDVQLYRKEYSDPPYSPIEVCHRRQYSEFTNPPKY